MTQGQRDITFHAFVGGSTSSQVGPFTTAFSRAQLQMTSEANIKIEIIDNKDLKSKNVSETKMRMDEQGRVLDEKGNIIQIKPESKSTLKLTPLKRGFEVS
jgi:hypothetical protein